ncbi:hypothetical protein BJ138DRAFT_1227604 [Hygrophoropsis aurantiaca]|uniref:Uncharacterized protein n=1 Tax=Hygrophoropsis aurantiaca TaxID=72124 RepID=A0ACB8AHZ9_9AGAM|nr:hypothetical protein BJ138DRAFT_1227604 [Hygrophoropsis aurantiaca]
MSSTKATPHVSERQDIHKSCRTLETLVNVLSDYSDTAKAIVTLQKKLAKALKDAANLKSTAEIPASALGASASIFEVLFDIDSKFVKIVDKECDGISSEVKKWFNKLSKEERAHDERLNDANARIEQASRLAKGQKYEKKSKKNPRDAGEEHARYVHLKSVLGPEMSQEKYNHALLVTQQHASVTINVAACLSRVADAEWARTCESIRKCSPTIGPLGEWRALCEGAWSGPLPDNLPDIANGPIRDPVGVRMQMGVSEWGQSGAYPTSFPSASSFPPSSGNTLASNSSDQSLGMHMPRPPFSTNEENQGSINSITTLSAFPFPPTHIPVPLTVNEGSRQGQRGHIQNLQVPQPNQMFPVVLSESPKPIEEDLPVMSSAQRSSTRISPAQESSDTLTPSNSRPPSDRGLNEKRVSAVTVIEGIDTGESSSNVTSGPRSDGQLQGQLSVVAREQRGGLNNTPSEQPSDSSRKTEYSLADREFGVEKERKGILKSHTVDVVKKGLERTESSTSTQSIVAVMRNRYSQTIETPSPSPKEVPKLPLSVSNLASRYQPSDEPLSPRRSSASPTNDRHFIAPETPKRRMTRDIPFDDDEIRRRRQRIEELAELELKEKEYELRQRERELNQKSRDFERNKQQFLGSHTDLSSSLGETPKGPRSSPFQHRHSQSTSHLIPPPSSSSASVSPSTSFLQQPQPTPSPSHSQPSTPLPSKEHAPFCGCDTCSVNKYKSLDASPSPRDLRPPEPPILLRPEKPKGWIRRLSMPVVNASFSLDAKKNISVTSLKAGLSAPAENGRLRKRSFEQGISNRTVGGIGRR